MVKFAVKEVNYEDQMQMIKNEEQENLFDDEFEEYEEVESVMKVEEG